MSFVSYAQNFEDVMLWRALKHVQNGVYVDVGAQHPVVDSVSKAFYERGWRGIHIEPVLAYADLLRKDRPDETVLQVALADTEGTLELNVISETGLSTAVNTYAQRQQSERGFEYQKIQVPVLTLKSALKSIVGKDVQWLKIDVEGFEEQVLKGWDSKTLRPWVMVVEATIPNSPEQNYASWDPIVIAAGYKFVYFDGLNRFYVAKEHAELAEAFSSPPNVFDGVQLSGLASWGLCRGLIASHQAREKEIATHSEDLSAELNVTNEYNTQLQNEWDAAKAKVDELNHSSHHWWTVADRLNQELQSVYASNSWRITLPLRKTMQAAKRALSRPTRTVRWARRQPKRIAKPIMLWAMRKTITNPRLKASAMAVLAKHPQLKQHLRQFAIRSGLAAGWSVASPVIQPSVPNNTVRAAHPFIMQTELPTRMPPRAARIYADLQKSNRSEEKLMRIVIDMQGAQSTGSRNRGIGRYTLSLAQAIVRNRGAHEVFLALNGLFPETIEPIRAAFDGLLPQEHIRVWQAPGPVSCLIPENDWHRRTAELIREAFFASLKPDIVLVSSLFEGGDDDAVTSVGTYSRLIPTAVVLYDLIPLIYRHIYLAIEVAETWYERKLDHLRRADLLLTISESSRQECIRYIGFPAAAAVNISTAADPQFQPIKVGVEQAATVRERYGLQLPFVMYTGGIDHRKNIEGLIRAYAKLPKSLRTGHQLAIVCSIQSPSRAALEMLAKKEGLKADELVLTGFVPEKDLVTLYNLCKVFVFPSWHEGFGLPALEAMSCGRAVIGANTSSVPEVIGRDDALFDPTSDEAITNKLIEVLTDDAFRVELEQYGLERAKCFSWDASAQRAIAAIETWHANKVGQSLAKTNIEPARRPKLAYLSPLPPERSGISDYSAGLLPELSRHYDIDVIVAQDSISAPWINANCQIRSVEWFRIHADRYDRVLYHFGNSHFHQHMFDLLGEIPGIVVLHDFFLSGTLAHQDLHGISMRWCQELYAAHGYRELSRRFLADQLRHLINEYPCNMGVVQSALGVIVHSENSRRLASQWYGEGVAGGWAVVPLLRVPEPGLDRAEARRLLKLGGDDFVVCSFGLLGPHKLNQRLLNAWLLSDLAKNVNCVLVFVGENHDGEYGADLLNTIRGSGLAKRIRITGWEDGATFHHYLAAVDVGVQLRTLTRGETSAAVLDCMNYGLPTIVNANGSMADLPDDGVWKLPDEFDDNELINALETLWRNPVRRQHLGMRAQAIILTRHAPRSCADQYAQAIETMYRAANSNVAALTHALASIEPPPSDPQALVHLAEAVALSIPPLLAPRQLLVDISELVQRDSKSDIQHAVRSILQELLTHPPEGYKVEPVYATPDQGYRYARRFTLRFLNCPESVLADDVIEFRAGDLFLGLDLQPQVLPAQQPFYQQLRNHGVRVQFVVYDLLPITLPNAFTAGATKQHHAWLEVVAESDGAICISKAVAGELADWLKTHGPARQRPFKINWFHLGADIGASAPSKGMPDNAEVVLRALL